LGVERLIHAGIFFLLLVGLTFLSAWLSYAYLQSNLVLVISSIALSWGIILLAMYVIFSALDWKWWS
jgi:predicted membrane protein